MPSSSDLQYRSYYDTKFDVLVCKVLIHLSKFQETSEVTHTIAMSEPKAETLQIESTPTATILFPLT